MVDSRWFSVDLNPKDPDAKENRKGLVEASTILDVLAGIVHRELETLDRASDDFTNPNWHFQEAHRVGQRKAYNNILNLTRRK